MTTPPSVRRTPPGPGLGQRPAGGDTAHRYPPRHGRSTGGSRRARAQPAATSHSTCPGTGSSSSPGCPARASRPWPSTPSTPRASAATSSRSRPTPASSWARWTSPTSTSSRGSPRPSPSTRSRRRATPARPWARSPRSTTTSACSTPGSACPTARSAAGPVARQSPQQIVDRILALDEGTRFLVLAPVVRGRKGEYGALLDDLAKQGFARVRVDGDHHRARRPGRARPGPLRERTPSRWWSTASSAATTSASRLTESLETALELAEGVAEVLVVDADGTEARRPSPSPSTWPAPTAASASRTRRPATSPSTRPTAPARRAPGSAPGSRSTPSWWCPTPT